MPHFATHTQAKFECVQRGVPFLWKKYVGPKYSNYDGTQQISHTRFSQLRYLGLPTDKQFEVCQYILMLLLRQFEEL